LGNWTRRFSAARLCPCACEFRRKVAGRTLLALVVLAGAAASAAPGSRLHAQAHQPAAREAAPHAPAAPAADVAHQPAGGAPEATGEHAAQNEHGAPPAHGSSLWSTVAKLINFAILAGTLVYFLRSPLMDYMRDRASSIRQDLVAARQMKSEAQAQLEAIDRRMRALPGELDELKARGLREIAAEEARIRQTAEAERARLVEQTRRDLDLQLRAARRELVAHAADLAVALASDRLRKTLTNEDHVRLADRFIRDVSGRAEAS
jgi:F-type H+-transporting ATPase subunit b